MPAKSNAERQKEYRQRQALKKQSQGSGDTPATGVPASGSAEPVAGAGEAEEEQLQVTINAPEPDKTTLSIREKLFGKKQGITPISKPGARRGAKGKRDVSLISQVLPVMLAGVVMVYIRDKLPEEYRPCAPTQEEAARILRPLFEEIARYIEVTGRASETTVNITNCIVAAMAYGCRAYCTYVEIKHDLQKGTVRHEQTSSNQQTGGPGSSERPATYGDGYRGNQGAYDGLAGNDANGYAGNQRGGYVGPDSSNGASDLNGAEQSERSDADKVADLFKRDRDGRVKLGLLAG